MTVVLVSPPVQLRVPPPGFAPIASVTVVAGALVTVAPDAFWRAIDGWTAKAPPGVPRAGCTVNPSLVGAPIPAEMSKDPLVSEPPWLHVAVSR